jgi:hypothetical protein
LRQYQWLHERLLCLNNGGCNVQGTHGIVQKVEFTRRRWQQPMDNHQRVRYATWWDIKTKKWKEGDLVEFETYEELWPVLAAELEFTDE